MTRQRSSPLPRRIFCPRRRRFLARQRSLLLPSSDRRSSARPPWLQSRNQFSQTSRYARSFTKIYEPSSSLLMSSTGWFAGYPRSPRLRRLCISRWSSESCAHVHCTSFWRAHSVYECPSKRRRARTSCHPLRYSSLITSMRCLCKTGSTSR